MFVLEYDQTPFTGYLYSDNTTVPPHVFLHQVEKTDAQALRKHLLRRVCGEPSFTALVRAFEASGMISDFWDYGIVGARLSIHYTLCARFLRVSEHMLLKLLTSEQFIILTWVPPHLFEEGIVFVSVPTDRGDALCVFRDVIARAYMLRNPCLSRVHYVLTSPLCSVYALRKHQVRDALSRFLEIESALTVLEEVNATVRDVLVLFFMKTYPSLAISIRVLLRPLSNI